jgi:hypothetical protein
MRLDNKEKDVSKQKYLVFVILFFDARFMAFIWQTTDTIHLKIFEYSGSVNTNPSATSTNGIL